MSSTPRASDAAAVQAPLIEARDLRVAFQMQRGVFQAIRGVSFSLGREKLAIVGESGSGKSTVGRAIMRLNPPSAIVTAERLTFKDVDLLSASKKELRRLRGRHISMIMQDPKYSLNPVATVGEQIAEAYRTHHKVSSREARERALTMLEAVQIRSPKRVYDLYPHQVSGGMGQRIMIAMMLISDPEVLIADEPTSALDVTVRLQILAILDDMVKERGLGMIFISHDLNLVRSFCDRVIIMYAGRIVETVAAADLDNVQHPYSRGLLNSLPRLDQKRDRLPVIQRDDSWLEAV
ncbi:ABC transporter ATP-binding protein [Oryzicola mucosus]|uniref:ABC transporter ATP-binding protein n=1 Tax=Oryzicola mucosus TaxID=2767425 RepID=A0A8J6U1N8_9HYPH|nr:ABC transporter ATP-binding protein [Oryzicola mucosus]MBD0417161.1 ABC transporter ATP-binding protein [Oryzicola mucosus]